MQPLTTWGLYTYCKLLVQTDAACWGEWGCDGVYLEVFWKEQFAGPQKTKNVAEYLAVPIYEVVLLQAVQHNGLGAIEQTTDSENWNTHTHARTHSRAHKHRRITEWAGSLQMHETITLHLFFNFISAKLEMH